MISYDLAAFPYAQRGGRFVHNDHLAAERHRPRDRNGLPLPARQRLDHLIDVLDRPNAESRDLGLRFAPHSALVHHVKPAPQESSRLRSRPRNRLEAMSRAGETASV